MSLPGTDASVASATTVWISSNRIALRATAITGVPLSARTWAIPRPRPRDAPTTMVVLSETSLGVMALCRRRGGLRLDEQRVLALELLGHPGAPTRGEHCRHGVGEDLL